MEDELLNFEEFLEGEDVKELLSQNIDGSKCMVFSGKVGIMVGVLFLRLCRKVGMKRNEMIKLMIESMVRYMSEKHNLTQESERLMSIFEHLFGWKDCFNLADPDNRPEITEATYYMRDPDKKGVRAFHVERPWFTGSNQWLQTYNIQEIFEQTICLLMPERYRRLRMLAVDNGCTSMLEFIDMIIDEYTKESDLEEMRQFFEDANRSEFGKKPDDTQYKRKHYKSVNDNRLTDPSQGSLFNDDIDGDELLNGI